jgi:TM2 domain-containing membrane protein YozV
MILCPSCGGENGDTVKFCVRCGATMAGAAPAPGSWQQPSAGVYDAPSSSGQSGSQYSDQTPPSYTDYPTYNPPVPQYQQAVDPNYWQRMGADKKIAAGICGILLGGLGVHKFVLGYTTEGIIMLLITILTCGIGAIVTSTIGLVEGIIYLVKSDEEFVRTYIQNKKGWF